METKTFQNPALTKMAEAIKEAGHGAVTATEASKQLDEVITPMVETQVIVMKKSIGSKAFKKRKRRMKMQKANRKANRKRSPKPQRHATH